MGFKTVWNGIFNKNKEPIEEEEPKIYTEIAEIILIRSERNDTEIKKFLDYLASLEALEHPDLSIKIERLSKKLFIRISSQYEYHVSAIRREINDQRFMAPGVIVQWIDGLY